MENLFLKLLFAALFASALFGAMIDTGETRPTKARTT
jgi:hypothetical protein